MRKVPPGTHTMPLGAVPAGGVTVLLRIRQTLSGAPNGIRTRVAALKGRCPGPLDDGGRTESGRRGDRHRLGYRVPAGHRAGPGSAVLEAVHEGFQDRLLLSFFRQ